MLGQLAESPRQLQSRATRDRPAWIPPACVPSALPSARRRIAGGRVRSGQHGRAAASSRAATSRCPIGEFWLRRWSRPAPVRASGLLACAQPHRADASSGPPPARQGSGSSTTWTPRPPPRRYLTARRRPDARRRSGQDRAVSRILRDSLEVVRRTTGRRDVLADVCRARRGLRPPPPSSASALRSTSTYPTAAAAPALTGARTLSRARGPGGSSSPSAKTGQPARRARVPHPGRRHAAGDAVGQRPVRGPDRRRGVAAGSELTQTSRWAASAAPRLRVRTVASRRRPGPGCTPPPSAPPRSTSRARHDAPLPAAASISSIGHGWPYSPPDGAEEPGLAPLRRGRARRAQPVVAGDAESSANI